MAARSRNRIIQAIGSIGSINLEAVINIMPEILGFLNVEKNNPNTFETEQNTIVILMKYEN
jgi:hypothetical protein